MHRSVSTGLAAVACAVIFVAGCKPGGSSPGTTATSAPAMRVAISIDSTGFNPPTVTAVAGRPVTLVFTRVTDETCATSIKIPSMKVEKVVPMNTPVEVTFTPGRKGDIDFACGMDMIKGVIVVE